MRNKFPQLISDEVMKEIVRRKKAGEETEALAGEFKVSTSSVANIYRNWRILGVLKSHHIKEATVDFLIEKCDKLEQENEALRFQLSQKRVRGPGV